MNSLPLKFITDNARNNNLIYWQINDGTNELSRQDEDLAIDESLQMLEDTFNELKEYARAGDKVTISLQSHLMSNKGKQKGHKQAKYSIYLREPEQRNTQSIGNIGMLEENVRLKLAMQHDKEKQELLKRIEALEAPEPEQSNLDKSIEGITHILNHPITSLVVSYFAGKSGATSQPAINGLPDYESLLNRIEKIDPQFIDMLTAIVTAAEENKAQYFMYRNMLVK